MPSKSSREMNRLPRELEYLILGDDFNADVVGQRIYFPGALKRLTFGSGFNRPLPGISFPRHLQHLTFGTAFNQAIHKVTAGVLVMHQTCGKQFFSWSMLKVARLLPSGYFRAVHSCSVERSPTRTPLGPLSRLSLTPGSNVNGTMCCSPYPCAVEHAVDCLRQGGRSPFSVWSLDMHLISASMKSCGLARCKC